MDRRFPFPIPNGWFQVAYSDELEPGRVLALRYFGKDLVIFRTENGEVALMDAFCPQKQRWGGGHQGEPVLQLTCGYRTVEEAEVAIGVCADEQHVIVIHARGFDVLLRVKELGELSAMTHIDQ